jgi:NTP pyrophosphatase (non-canonical NTP hydrolase)
MDIDLYQEFTSTTDLMPTHEHLLAGLCAEVGEVASLFQKWERGGRDNEFPLKDLEKELGDVMWHVSELSNIYQLSLANILIKNRDKLIDRQNRNVIEGSGDNR